MAGVYIVIGVHKCAPLAYYNSHKSVIVDSSPSEN
jgi:hypothetical protein